MPRKHHILIAGGKGLVGSRLTELLLEKGYKVAHLSRTKTGYEKVETYLWQPDRNRLEPGAVENASHIVQLAGANLGEKRWTESRKQELLKSRTETTRFLVLKLQTLRHRVKGFISASGINYYGADTGDQVMREADPPGKDFIGQLCLQWETAAFKANELGMRTVTLRCGLAISKRGGFLKALMPLAKAGLSAPLGSGKQYISWIHIDDLCHIYIKAIEDEGMEGAYNAAAPMPVTNKEFMKTLAQTLGRPFFAPPAPAIAIKLALGELASSLLGGVRASTLKLESAGFRFLFPELVKSLEDIFQK